MWLWLSRKAPILATVCVCVLACALPVLLAQTNVANSSASLAGKTLITAEGAWTVTGLWSFSRSTSAPFAVNANAAKVTNLDADKLDGLDSTYFLDATHITSGVLAIANGGLNTATVPSSGQIPIGNGTGYTVTGISAGTGIVVTPTTGAISISATISAVYDRNTTGTVVSNTGTETSVYSKTIAGGQLSTNKYMRITMLGDYVNNSGSTSIFTIRVKYGGTTFTTMSYSFNSGATHGATKVQADVLAKGATNTQEGFGSYWWGAGNTGGASGGIFGYDFTGHTGMAIDSTADQTLQITVQHSFTSSSTTWTTGPILVEIM